MGKTQLTGNLTNAISQDASNNVGIGAAPSGTYKLEVTGTGRFTSTLLVSGALTGSAVATFTAAANPLILKSTSATTGYTEYYYNTSTLAGVIGNGGGILTGANNSDFIVRSEADFVVATGGNNRKMTITSTGNVGINSTTPNFKLHISTGTTTSITQPTAGSYGLYIQQNTSGSTGGLYIQDGASNSGNSIFVGDNNGAARFVVNTDGNVGIGTDSPNELFEVKGTENQGIRLTSTATSGEGANLQWFSMQSGDNKITAEIESDGSSTGGNLFFKTRSTSGVLTERMNITNGGKVVIDNSLSGDITFFAKNTSSSGYGAAIQGGSGSLYSLKVDNYVATTQFRVDGNGGIYAPNIGAATGTAMILDGAGFLRTLSSSIRYKKDIKPIDIGLDFILSLNPVSYNLKDGDKAQVGFIAEDFPEERLVSMSMIDSTDESKGYQIESVNYAQIVAPLVKAIQEQQATITSLQDRLDKAGL